METVTAVTFTSPADEIRKHLAEVQQLQLEENKPLRHVDPNTGALSLYASADTLQRYAPNLGWDVTAVWCKLPIFKCMCFLDRESFAAPGRERPYAEHLFPDGEDLATALLYWRKRVNQEGKGFAVFEAGFDTSGLVYLTEAPRISVDAVTGEVDADSAEEIERKRTLHNKRKAMDARWAAKGLSEEARRKIEDAELLAADRRKNGEAYMMRCGWVSTDKPGVDVTKHNNLQKRFDCR
jgi:hypothetical protein